MLKDVSGVLYLGSNAFHLRNASPDKHSGSTDTLLVDGTELRGKNTNGVEMKEELAPFGKENGSREDSGGGGSGSGSGDHFVPFDEEKNNGKRL
ncbi:unnamed protein product [Porites evermanni]|uniref:Uncharacterized protein n=1 Tax=Porites evermanni TaxID=104178 RepID=A0ABN8SK37_9CNID|nr:unnamed protein product [Porites evermanni]